MATILKDTYELREKLGAGGGGEAYMGYHLRLQKDVVIKRDKNPSADEKKLRQEVDTLKSLSHTYIPQVYDFIRDGDDAYTVMDFIDGESLDKPLERGEPLAQRDIIEWAFQLLDALGYLHAHKILHSDIKPANIMLTPEGDIRLIDFNVSLALGEDGTVKVYGTRGYASPEYFTPGALDATGLTQRNTAQTGTTRRNTAQTGVTRRGTTQTGFSVFTADGRILDARADIYALGATLYHLLTGRRPAQHATDVLPVDSYPDRAVSPALAAVIKKAMAPDPDDRYQSADDMRRALLRLHRDDPRARRHRRAMAAAFAAIAALLLLGGALTYVGLHRMERSQNAIALSGRSARALQDGDVLRAVTLALDALPVRGPFDPPDSTDAQRALANALGVYDLDTGYKAHAALPLPAMPVNAGLSPDGRYAVALSDNRFFVFDTDSGRQLAALPAEPSPLSGYAFRDPDTLLYAGADGLSAYNIPESRNLWANGRPATTVALSADGRTVATVYRDASEALICDAYSGDVTDTVSFDGKRQRVAVNDSFSRSTGVLCTLDAGGNWLAVSFDDGGLSLFGIRSGEVLELLTASDFAVFEGGFIRNLFAFVGNRTDGSSQLVLFNMTARDAMQAANTVPMHAQIDAAGVCLSQETRLVRLDPQTYEQAELAYYPAADITSYLRAGDNTLVRTSDGACLLYDRNGIQIADFTRDAPIDFVDVAGDYVLFANRDTASVQLLRSERHADAHWFSYDSAYPHTQAHVLKDGSSAMLISPQAFRIIRPDGSPTAAVELPDMEQMYSQSYKRDDGAEFLDCRYNDGTVRRYSATTGGLLSTNPGPVPDLTMHQSFETDDYIVEFDYRDTPELRRRSNGKLIRALEVDGNIWEVTQTGENLIIQYVSSDLRGRYAVLVDAHGQILADLPNLCDILPGNTLIFDDGIGNLRRGRLYTLAQLRALAEQYKEARK
ncbi:MAG: protein kinase [Oscillibacter sp.]|nr:protein kinase [Oscillibacter sp.]